MNNSENVATEENQGNAKDTTQVSQRETYLQLRQKSQQEQDQEALSWDADENKSNLEGDIRETKKALRLEEKRLKELKSQVTLSSADILECQDTIKALNAGVIALEELIEELFN